VFGNLDWSDGQQTVRSPLTLKALSLSAPTVIEDNRVRANRMFTVGSGYDGVLRGSSVGLVAATRTTKSVNFGDANCSHSITVPAGANALRVALFDGDTTGNGLDDLDLEVYNAASGQLVGASGGVTAHELVELASPPAGSYVVCVVGFGTAQPGATSTTYTLSHWVVAPGTGLANSLRVSTPATVVTAGTGTVSFVWAVAAGQRYYTTVQFTDGANAPVGRTGLYIDNVSATIAAPASNGSKDLIKRLAAERR
jgi:hypothetical protein